MIPSSSIPRNSEAAHKRYELARPMETQLALSALMPSWRPTGLKVLSHVVPSTTIAHCQVCLTHAKRMLNSEL